MCRVFKPEADFALRSISTGKRQDHCRQCHAAYRRQHYLKNRDAYIAREVARIAGYRLDNRLRLFEYLSAHPCVDCDERDPVVLEFDHRDPASKRREVTYIAVRKPWKFALSEIAKCDVRCANCHRRRTAEQFQWYSPGGTDGVVKAADQRSDAAPPILCSPLAPAEVRECTACRVIKSISKFSVKNKQTGRRAWRCHSCVAVNSREHYRQNRQSYLDRGRRNKRSYRQRNHSRKGEYVAGLACVDCGEIDPVVLEFDHRDGVEKVDEVSRLMAVGSWTMVAIEIAKCDLRCVNCHRRRTAAQFGWMKQSLQVAAKMAAARV